MTRPLTPREKVAQTIRRAIGNARVSVEQAGFAADRVLTALASGSGDHAELAKLADDPAMDFGGFGRARVIALLTENAALRAACDNANGHWKKTQAAWSEVLEATGCKDGGELVDKATRATEAERKLVEAVGLLRGLADYTEKLGENLERNDLDMHLDACERPLSAVQPARTFLSKEAERG